ncbi:indole-3-glycerol phosphate synthase TrpC [uncultured Eudoraea sp.]|uniref:indole-3-glycerol phosphate synthase TrpC n=1 Tax=uncultured Eudoraea sp. TaxID=1035614 RepID=UPI00260967CA|nr:indole-3-glycerol phosphate synthase TrpC [uncultured Eudoraea sp.]
MNILEKIVADKKKEIRLKKAVIPVRQLEASSLFQREPLSLAHNLRDSKTGIIAEHKRRSPSKSVINQNCNVQDVASGYMLAGACGMSVLTDGKYFGGSLDDLLLARSAVEFPLLRKEFIIDEYQVIESRSHGADTILLIAAILSRKKIKILSELAKSLQLDVLLEVHNEEELVKSLMPSLDMLGVNNRNLKTFEVNLETSAELSEKIPDEFVKVSESGISSVSAINELREFGYRGFLIGENFMKTANPGESAGQFIKQLGR